MSYISTIYHAQLPGGGEVHVYDTIDPTLTDGHTPQRRLNVRIPGFNLFPGIDFDERLDEPSPSKGRAA
jgi:hypothetical protein